MTTSFDDQIERYNEYKDKEIYLVKMRDGAKVVFLHENKHLENFNDENIVVSYPLVVNATQGDVDFAQYAEFGQERVVINLANKVTLSKPIKAVALAYYKAIRRIRFALEHIDLADKVMKKAIMDLSFKENRKVTEMELKGCILSALDKILDEANGDFSEENVIGLLGLDEEEDDAQVIGVAEVKESGSDNVINFMERLNKNGETVH